MPVLAESFLRQSLEQSLRPNEEESTDSTHTSPHPRLGPQLYIVKYSPTERTNDFAPCQGKC